MMINIPEFNYTKWILKMVILLQCAGVFFLLQSGSAVEGMLFMDYGLPQTSSKQIEKAVGLLFLFLGFFVFIRPFQIILVVLASMFLALAWIIQLQGGSPFTEWSLFAHAVRILLPVTFIFIMKEGLLYKKVAFYLLVFGLSITFITHGLEAISLHPYFIDYLITTAKRLVEFNLTESVAGIVLKTIGSLDILVGLSILTFRSKWLFLWMAVWGFITAFARITELGWGMFPEVLVRAVHFGGPVALGLLLQTIKELRRLTCN